MDLAARNPRVVERLRAAYEDWWAGLQPAFADYTRIVLGAEAGNPARLMAHDLHEKPCYSQQGVKSGDAADGFWAVEIAREGEYEFALRRWPEELDLPIRAAGPGKALDYSEARVQIGGLEASALVGEEDKAALVRLRLPAGAARLRATFLDSRGQENAAYYVHATRLE
ncbi:MAG: hypothetical protein BWZ10_02895 [candidate division BRC1 bacterium ADurb.BinA364]|nr:MAG: hypothetical protein BWZ10_02895 [candidate division BRC1 bacterium ADurb.BinA364]